MWLTGYLTRGTTLEPSNAKDSRFFLKVTNLPNSVVLAHNSSHR